MFFCETPLRCWLSFRDDPERQGESGDVVAWPPLSDPRAKTVCRALVLGLAAKIAHYFGAGICGLPATLRRAVQFLRRTHYPSHWWRRAFALALQRRGYGSVLLPKSLRMCCVASSNLRAAARDDEWT